jgi:hypothetical protein
MTKAQRDIARKIRVLQHAQEAKNISKTCHYFGISRQCFYDWQKAYHQYGEKGLINSKPCPENPTLRVPPDIEKNPLSKKDLSFRSIANFLVFRAVP